ncbi:uncharacterized protein LOC112191643 [Rosa chinensis]|uniref:uncharacterized protein LOC112191643 n=1 Tax=Rosa chinensis TaxID=74649 RepID=UPI001AD8D841|nr:uncharacterized protein LOC112191643 [Rosa chinensis]
MLAYEPAINPILGVDEWEVVERPILPPRYTRGPGRPKLSRNKEPGEQAPTPGTTKLSRSYHQSLLVKFVKKMAIIRGLVQGDSNKAMIPKLGFNHQKLMIRVSMWSKLKMFKVMCKLKVICIMDHCSKLQMYQHPQLLQVLHLNR